MEQLCHRGRHVGVVQQVAIVLHQQYEQLEQQNLVFHAAPLFHAVRRRTVVSDHDRLAAQVPDATGCLGNLLVQVRNHRRLLLLAPAPAVFK